MQHNYTHQAAGSMPDSRNQLGYADPASQYPPPPPPSSLSRSSFKTEQNNVYNYPGNPSHSHSQPQPPSFSPYPSYPSGHHYDSGALGPVAATQSHPYPFASSALSDSSHAINYGAGTALEMHGRRISAPASSMYSPTTTSTSSSFGTHWRDRAASFTDMSFSPQAQPPSQSQSQSSPTTAVPGYDTRWTYHSVNQAHDQYSITRPAGSALYSAAPSSTTFAESEPGLVLAHDSYGPTLGASTTTPAYAYPLDSSAAPAAVYHPRGPSTPLQADLGHVGGPSGLLPFAPTLNTDLAATFNTGLQPPIVPSSTPTTLAPASAHNTLGSPTSDGTQGSNKLSPRTATESPTHSIADPSNLEGEDAGKRVSPARRPRIRGIIPTALRELEPSVKPAVEAYLLQYLNRLCRDPEAKDRMGHLIHQSYTSKRTQRYEQMYGWRPLKFRIEAFVNGFIDLLTAEGFAQDVIVKIPHYLNSCKLFSRFNESGNRMKSQGQTIWRVRARCRPAPETEAGEIWEFLPYERSIVGMPPLAIVGSPWQWNLKVHDHWAPRKKIVWSVQGMPSWMGLQSNKLRGTPRIGENCQIIVTAKFQEESEVQPIVVQAKFTVQVSRALGGWKKGPAATIKEELRSGRGSTASSPSTTQFEDHPAATNEQRTGNPLPVIPELDAALLVPSQPNAATAVIVAPDARYHFSAPPQDPPHHHYASVQPLAHAY